MSKGFYASVIKAGILLCRTSIRGIRGLGLGGSGLGGIGIGLQGFVLATGLRRPSPSVQVPMQSTSGFGM